MRRNLSTVHLTFISESDRKSHRSVNGAFQLSREDGRVDVCFPARSACVLTTASVWSRWTVCPLHLCEQVSSLSAPWRTNIPVRRLGPRLCPPIKEVSPLSVIYWETSVSSVHMREWGKKRGHCFQRVWGNKQKIFFLKNSNNNKSSFILKNNISWFFKVIS